MSQNIHKTAIINGEVKIGNNVTIGAFSVLNGKISIDDNVQIDSHVNIQGDVEIGKNNRIYSFASIGTEPQDIKFKKGTVSKVKIGDNNIIREYVTINGGGEIGNAWRNIKNTTVVGNNCYLYISSHIAHDVVLGDNVTVTNLAGISGHVLIEDNVIIGGMSGIHQNVKIGRNCMVGAMCPIGASILPFCLTQAMDPNKVFSLNLIGLRRANFLNEDIKLIQKTYNYIYKDKINISGFDLTFSQKELESKLYKEIMEFTSSLNSRGLLEISDRIVQYGF